MLPISQSWQEDKRWADLFIPHSQQLLGLACIHVADIDQDRRENTDLIFEVGTQRIAVRIRRIEQRLTGNYRNEITFRFQRRSGAETELRKLMNGWGDAFLYGWGDDRSQRIQAYTLLDLHKLRGWIFEKTLERKELPGEVKHNRDGSAFLILCLDCMPQEIIRKRVSALMNDPPNIDMHWRLYHQPAA